ncbi:MAG: 2-oxoacid:acceptor oxidoreductase family protein [Candidatus Omnitrophota bacterium]
MVTKTVEKKRISRFEILMDAGFGAQSAGDILIKAFARTGKFVYIEPMIPAEISPPPRTRPALSGAIIRVADFDITNIGNNTDLILAAHEIVLDRRFDDGESNPQAKILLDVGDQSANKDSYEKVLKRVKDAGLTVIPFELDAESNAIIRSLGNSGKNMYYIGMLAAIYNTPHDAIITEIKRTFGKKLSEEVLNKNISLFHNGYKYAEDNIALSYEVAGTVRSTEKILIDGNTSLAMGIIDAGIKIFAGYPITPASSIMHTLAKVFPSYGGMVHQAEDEISAIGSAIGSYFGGVPSITATSGPGLSLKQEFIGFASSAEIPLIVIDAQRGGPSTGLPTKTEQSDLLAAAFGSHGDAPKVVLSVANVIDCFYAPTVARYIAEKLRIPVMLMTDFQTANSYKVIDKLPVTQLDDINKIPDFVLERFHMKRLPDTIEMVCANQADPGTPEMMRRVTGLNTDAKGVVSHSGATSLRSHQIRGEKVHHVQRALTKPEMFGKESGDLLVVGWGSTRGVIEEAIDMCKGENLSASGMHLKIVHPLPLMLKDIFTNFKKVVTVEVAYGDELAPPPLALLLRSATLADVQPALARPTGRPITPRGILSKIKEILK